MNNSSLSQQQPIIIHEKIRENQSKDVAAIIQAASKSNSVLSSVWLRRRENHFRIAAAEVGIAGVSGGMAMGGIAALMGASVQLSIGIALAGMMVAAAAIVFLVFHNADILEYEVNYEATSDQQANTQKITYRIETQKGHRTNYVNMPTWFEAAHVAALLRMNEQGERFNVRNTSKHGVCTQQQFAELRDGMARAQLLEKNGKTWELAPEFFAFAKQTTG